LPSNKNLVGAEIELVDTDGREFALKKAIAPVLGSYDYVIIDSPPSLGLLTVNAMVAARELLIPIQAEYYALEGVGELLDTIHRIRVSANPDLSIRGLLLTMVDERTNLAKQVVEEVRNCFGEVVFETVIPRNVKIAESPGFGKPIMLYDVTSKGAIAYLKLAKEFVANG
jgi:chromosome partitioning protein